MTNQKQSVGGRLAGAKSDPGIPKEESARRARARSQAAPSGRLLWLSNRSGSAGRRVRSPFLSLPRERKRKR